jgi:hypothetical protein
MFVYTQSKPTMTHNGVLMPSTVLYSGRGPGLNMPSLEMLENIGPIPAGLWKIIKWWDHYEKKGPCVAQLSPVGHDAHGRVGFLCHGPHANDHFDSSDGCIVADHVLRTAMRATGDMDLTVTPGGQNGSIANVS